MKRKIITLLICGLVYTGSSQNEDFEILQENIKHWINLKKEISTVKNDWKTEKQLLERELSILDIEKQELTEELKTVNEKQTQIGQEIENLRTEKAELDKTIKSIEPAVAKAEKDLLSLKKYIPTTLYPTVKTEFESITNTKNRDNIIDRLRKVITLYLKIETMQHEIHIARQIFSIKNNEKVEMEVLYIGLAQGFAVSLDGKSAKTGTPSENGWVWKDAPEYAAEILEAISVYSREEAPKIINLPVEISEVIK